MKLLRENIESKFCVGIYLLLKWTERFNVLYMIFVSFNFYASLSIVFMFLLLDHFD